jgi:hypothetical protein
VRAAIIHRDPLLADACARALAADHAMDVVVRTSIADDLAIADLGDLGAVDVLVTIPTPPGAPAVAGPSYDAEVRAAIDQVLPGMVERRFGRIVVIVRATGLEPADGGDAAASHWAAVGTVRHVARQAAADGVAINAVRIGLVDGHEGAVLPPTVAPPPLVRRGTPDEIAGSVRYLASVDAGFVAGAVLPVDGGLSIGQGV